MKKRVLSALLVLCLACGLVSTAWATGGDVTASVPSSVTQNADETDDSSVVTVTPTEPTDDQNTTDVDTTIPSDKMTGEEDENSDENDNTSGGESSSNSADESGSTTSAAGEDETAGAPSDEGQDDVQPEGDNTTEQPSVSNGILSVDGQQPATLNTGDIETYAATNADGTLTYNGYQLFHGEDTASQGITINVFDYDTVIRKSNNRESSPINFDGNSRRPFLFLYDPGSENGSMGSYNRNDYTTGVRSNIVGTELVNGYPQLAGNGSGLSGSNRSLAYLFDPAQEVSGKTTYANANYLFQKDSDGYYYFDSEDNFATLIPKADNEEGNNFWLYPNASNVWVYNYSNGLQTRNQEPQFMPFNTIAYGGNEYDQEDGHTGNYHFGMTVEFDFLLPENGKLEDGSDMTFEFTGDDDVWVYIDGHRVLDLGGIHPSQSGTINFATGEVRVNNQRTGYVWDLVNMSADEWKATEYQTHNLKFFYLERGAGGSNCALKFNMPTIPKNAVAVTKRVTGDVPEGTATSYTMEFVPEGNYSGWEGEAWTNLGDSQITVGNNTLSKDNATFTVSAGDTVFVQNVPADMPFTIKEVGVQPGVGVSFNGGESIIATENVPDVSQRFNAGTRSVTVTNNYPLEPVTPEHRKYIELNEDGTYDLTLNVTGAVDTAQGESSKVDILYVLDNSTSMDGRVNWWDRTTRLQAAKNAISALENTLREDKIDVQHAMVIFSSEDYYNTYLAQGWTSDPLNLDAISTTHYANGTNYQAGIQEAKTALATGTRDDAIQVMIFISDGEPNRPNNSGLTSAQTEISDLTIDRLYAIGVGDEVGLNTLKSLIDAAGNVPAENKNAYSSSDSEQLSEIFSGLAAEILSADVSDVTITDTLSQYAKLATNATFAVTVDGGSTPVTVNPTSFAVEKAMEPNGASGHFSYGSGEDAKTVGFTVKYDDVQNRFTLNFDDNYKLENGWTYSITTQVEPTDTAYNYYRDNAGEYPDMGEENTDAPDVAENKYISDGKPGFFSNSSATLTYDSANQQDIPIEYNKPVIQVNKTSLTITKVFQNEDGTALTADEVRDLKLLDNTKFTVKLGNTTVASNLALNSNPDDSYSYSVTVSDLYINGNYTVEETNTVLDYNVETSVLVGSVTSNSTTGSITLQKDADANVVAFTNKYAPSNHVLTVIKTVDGQMGDTTDSTKFTFELTLHDSGNNVVTNAGTLEATVPAGTTFTGPNADGVYTFELWNGQQATITIPAGYTVTVKETYDGGYSTYFKVSDTYVAATLIENKNGTADNGYDKWVVQQGYKTGKVASASMASDQTINFVNYRGIVAPTGLESNHTAPYTIMITVAGIAGLALIGGMVARRVRRRREE